MSNNILSLQSSSAATRPLKVNLQETRKAALILRAVNHKLRQQMLKLISKKGKISVVEIYTTMRMEQSDVSRHLGLLRQAGFVHPERRGKYILYSIKENQVEDIAECASKLSAAVA